jgi:hypothetical protein
MKAAEDEFMKCLIRQGRINYSADGGGGGGWE